MIRTFILIALCTLVTGCGWWSRVDATFTQYSRICIEGVSYLQFTSGASVEYTTDGKVRTCK